MRKYRPLVVGLLFGAHIPATEPAGPLPMPSRAVPVPRLMIW